MDAVPKITGQGRLKSHGALHVSSVKGARIGFGEGGFQVVGPTQGGGAEKGNAPLFREVNESPGIGRGDGEGFVDEDRLARLGADFELFQVLPSVHGFEQDGIDSVEGLSNRRDERDAVRCGQFPADAAHTRGA